MNEDRELYVDLQLDDWIQPDDNFPVGVTTGKILQEDWWQQSWIILNWKTTSWDYVRFIYANDGKLYYDPWTWVWIEIWWWGSVQINVATASSLWLIKLGSDTQQTESQVTATSVSGRTYPVQLNADNQAVVNVPWEEYLSLVEAQGGVDVSLVTTWEKYTWNHKQDKLTAWANITIDQNNEISATIPSALIYKWSVNDLSDLPSSWTVWDTYFVIWEDGMYSWTGSQWDYVWGTGIDTSDLFNKTIDTSDDIVQGTTNLFVTAQEKSDWNGKQDPIQAGQNITIDQDWVTINAVDTTYSAWDWISIDVNNVISNDAKFDPENAGSLGQFLKKTNDGYAWADIPWWWGWATYTAWDGININSNNVISNTKPFDPTNNGRIGQVLKKSGANSYYWADESWWGGWWWVSSVNGRTWAVTVNEVPSGWNTGQVLTKTSTWYAWSNDLSNVRCWGIDTSWSFSSSMLQEVWEWISLDITNKWAILRDSHTDDAFIYVWTSTSWSVIKLLFRGNNRYTGIVTAPNGWNYTKWWCNDIEISIDISGWAWNYQYSAVIKETDDDYIKTNYISAMSSGYDDNHPYLPTDNWQPSTKAYVDQTVDAALHWVTPWTPIITNDRWWTQSTITAEWVGTQAQYNTLVNNNQISPSTIYNII